MELLFKQRLFSWLDSYDIYDKEGNTIFTVKGQLDWGKRLEIYDNFDIHVGTIKQIVVSFMPRFEMFVEDVHIGDIEQEFALFKSVFHLDYQGWVVTGDVMGWNFQVDDADGTPIMDATKDPLNFTDTYSIEVFDLENALISLMIVLAINAARSS